MVNKNLKQLKLKHMKEKGHEIPLLCLRIKVFAVPAEIISITTNIFCNEISEFASPACALP